MMIQKLELCDDNSYLDLIWESNWIPRWNSVEIPSLYKTILKMEHSWTSARTSRMSYVKIATYLRTYIRTYIILITSSKKNFKTLDLTNQRWEKYKKYAKLYFSLIFLKIK